MDHTMSHETNSALDASLRTFQKRGLPEEFSSTYPHGLISGQPRSAAAEKSFQARKATILRTMTKEQIEEAYNETAKKILGQLDEDKKKNEEIAHELQLLEDQRELERKIYRRQKDEKDKSKPQRVEDLVKEEASKVETSNGAAD